MAMNFPPSPTLGQTYSEGAGRPVYQWNGTAWINLGSAMAVDLFTYIATGGETTVAVTGGYLAGLGILARGGAVQMPGDDVDISNGTSILFATPLAATEVIQFFKFRGFSLIDGLTKSQNLADVSSVPAARSNIGASAAFNFVQGLSLANNVADPVNDIDHGVGAAQAGTAYVANGAALTKRLDANWAAGHNAGGLDLGTKAANSTYHGWALRKDSDGSFDVVYSLSATAPAVPAGYARIQRIGAILTDGSGAIRPFLQDGNEFTLRVAAGLSAYSGTANRATALLTTPLPTGIRVLGLFTGILAASSTGVQATTGTMTLADGTDINAQTITLFDVVVIVGGSGTSNNFGQSVRCRTNLTAQVHLGIQYSNGGTSSLSVRGWIDESIPRIGA